MTAYRKSLPAAPGLEHSVDQRWAENGPIVRIQTRHSPNTSTIRPIGAHKGAINRRNTGVGSRSWEFPVYFP